MLSIVVPVLDEAESLRELAARIRQATAQAGVDCEVIFVDDGSSDGSWGVIAALAAENASTSGIRFRRNFGKAAALTAGMRAAKGDLILILDADLQDDPAEIPRFIETLNQGYDVVNGWKQNRQDPWHKVYPSKVFNWMVSALTELKLHDHNCGFKLFRAAAAAEIRLYGEMHRFIPALAHARGFRVTEIPVVHRPRRHGRSKYGFSRFARGFLDLLTVKFLIGYQERPLHVLGGVGLLFFALGGLGLGYLTLLWLLTNVFHAGNYGPIGSRPLLIYSVASMILGAQAISLGLLAELLVSYSGRDVNSYSIAEQTAPGAPREPGEPAVPGEPAA